MAERRPVQFGIQVAQMTGAYEGIRDTRPEADGLGFDTASAPGDHLVAPYWTHWVTL